MKKKTLITLAVVLGSIALVSGGIAFAYFMVVVGGTGNTENNTSTITTISLGSIYYNGETVFESDNMYPGMMGIQTFKIGPEGTKGTGTYEINLEGVLPEAFGTDVEITLYKTTDSVNNNISITEGTFIETGEVAREDTLAITGTPEVVYGPVALENNEKIVLETIDFDVTNLEETTYYLVYHYKNNGDQDNQQGLTFSGKVTVRLLVSTEATTDGVIASAPELYEGLIPVTYDEFGNVIVADSTQAWYNYGEREWANAVLVDNTNATIKAKYFNDDMSIKTSAIGETIAMDEILQMYVWIPRYSYKLFNAENGTSTEQAIEITFVGTDVKEQGSSNGEMLTHPAFTFGSTELNGFWVGKFEMSGTTSAPTIKPNLQSLTAINVSTMFNALRAMDETNSATYGINATQIDTHMMKNMEWGAVAYLINSIYGRYETSDTCIESGCEVWINNVNTGTGISTEAQWGPSITGCSASEVSAAVANNMTACADGYDWTKLGVNASTTGNMYGIYDMSGGAWEYVMGAMLSTDGISMHYSSSGFILETQPLAKYYDIYDYQASDGYQDATTISRMHLGDATKEIMTDNTTINGTYSWYEDWAWTVYGMHSWAARGGYYGDNAAAGVFGFSRNTGGARMTDSFRSVLSAA